METQDHGPAGTPDFATRMGTSSGWRLAGRCEDGEIGIRAEFVVDATGVGALPSGLTGVHDTTGAVRTNTRAVFAHFRGVRTWAEEYAACGGRSDDHPYPCDAAALHHLIDGGWMWVLRFDNGITSAGLSLDPRRYGPRSLPAEEEWRSIVSRYPSIARQFAEAEAVTPWVSTGRLQRRWSAAAGEDWAMLPHTACFVDPWLSPGIAHTLYGVARLARALRPGMGTAERQERLEGYSLATLREYDLIDRLSAGCFANLGCFPALVATGMMYFAAAIYSEERVRAGLSGEDAPLLLATDPRFAGLVAELTDEAQRVRPAEAEAYVARVAAAIEPFNTVGLMRPGRRNLYAYEC